MPTLKGSDKKKKIDNEANRMKIGSPKATNEIANNTLVHSSKGFASGNCQK